MSILTKTKGILKNWNRDRAFGFITTTDEFGIKRDCFLHVSNILAGLPVLGSECVFIMGAAPKGATALEVTFFNPQEPKETKQQDDPTLLGAQNVLAGLPQ